MKKLESKLMCIVMCCCQAVGMDTAWFLMRYDTL